MVTPLKLVLWVTETYTGSNTGHMIAQLVISELRTWSEYPNTPGVTEGNQESRVAPW